MKSRIYAEASAATLLLLGIPSTKSFQVTTQRLRPTRHISHNYRKKHFGHIVNNGNVGILAAIPRDEDLDTTTRIAPNTSSDLEEGKLDSLLSDNSLRDAATLLKSRPDIRLTKDRIYKIFDTIEYRTGQLDENVVPIKSSSDGLITYPPVSKARMEMTDMYETLKNVGVLGLFGAIDKNNFPAGGSKIVTPTTLETITEMSMTALTPKNSQTPLLFAGVLFAILEGVISLYTGIPLSALVFGTLVFALVDRIVANGAAFETALKLVWPEYSQKILKHEAGHFLLAYLLGCPVEGCVLSSLEAMRDYRFGGPFTSVSAGTSFFDPVLSEQVNNIKPLSRSSIDRFTIIVMGGIAAEAIAFGRADGGAGDEMSLVRFLTQINPRGGGAKVWDAELIRNQARWGAVQAVMLLKQYKPCYDALVDALESGGKLGQCVYAIEKAAKDNGLGPLKHPVGFIRDRGQFGEWEPYSPELAKEEEAVGADRKLYDGESAERFDAVEDGDFVASSEEFLKKYRAMMEEKVREIDSKLGAPDP